ncbi:MAG: tyrosine-type recombinase/integrase [Kouleothrix sp.]
MESLAQLAFSPKPYNVTIDPNSEHRCLYNCAMCLRRSIRFHDLRHTAATPLLADNVPLVTVSKILGHSSPAITATIYAHALDESKTGAIAGLAQRLEQAR